MSVERKQGEWLKENTRDFGDTNRRVVVDGNDHKITLADVGVSKDESSKAQRIAVNSLPFYEAQAKERLKITPMEKLPEVDKGRSDELVADKGRLVYLVEECLPDDRLRVEWRISTRASPSYSMRGALVEMIRTAEVYSWEGYTFRVVPYEVKRVVY